MDKTLSTAAAHIVAALCLVDPVAAQVAGSTALGDAVAGGSRFALGWSVTKTSPGTSDFIGSGRPVVTGSTLPLREPTARIVVPIATLDLVRTRPRFGHSDDGLDRAGPFAGAGRNAAKEKIVELHQRLANVGIDPDPPESKLAGFKRALHERWKAFQTDLNAAAARLHKAIDGAG